MKLFDTHCHLTWDPEKNPPAEQLARARASGVDQFVCVATNLENAPRCRELSRQHEDVRATIGIHPNDVGSDDAALEESLASLETELQTDSWSAVGETGLDFYRDWTEPTRQRHSFLKHLTLGRQLDLPVIIHCRHAAEATLETLQSLGGSIRGVMHCYSEGPEFLDGFLDLGLHISFAGNVTYPKSDPLRQSAARVPVDRLLVETDAPFLAPQAVRGRRNEPAYIRHTLECLAKVRGEDPEALARQTHTNACQLFP